MWQFEFAAFLRQDATHCLLVLSAQSKNGHRARLTQVNQIQLYVIYNGTRGNIGRQWGRYTSALDVWKNYYRTDIDLIERSWHLGMDDELLKERGRLAALRTLAYAYEAQGDATAATRFHV
ncbi:hypothetical protein B0H13DRAFT_2387072 [Mycena leptocephala]|nr:hypothetical protein B0H13DRAFT_2387072 [Mycena leptocephala]